MLFSDQYGIAKKGKDDWFDPILDHDTRLFIDPFLIFKLGAGPFKTAHADLIHFFDKVFEVAAVSGGKPHHPSFRKLHNMLMFPEVHALCLGYSMTGVRGAGTARGFSRVIAAAVFESIALGIQKVDHFEEVGIFSEGIGPDRISDITANILKPHLVAYTQEVAKRHKLPTKSFLMPHVGFDYDHMIWHDQQIDLPINPFTESAVLLVPQNFLRQLPTINVGYFWDFAWETKGEVLRDDLNYELKSKVNKKGIIALAKEKLFWVRDYMKTVANKLIPVPYDLESDPDGLYQWDKASRDFASQHPLGLAFAVVSPAKFEQAVELILEKFQLFVEDNAGYKLLWDGKRGKPEEASQLLFLGVATSYCEANDIDVSREANLGRGPVDFKFSSGYQNRALIEVKLARNTKFWNGLEKQLPTYMKTEGVTRGYFLVVCYSAKEMKRRTKIINRILDKVRKTTGYDIRVWVIDATPNKKSASKL